MFLRFLKFEEGGISILIEIHPESRFGGCFRSARNSLYGIIRDNTYMPLQKLGRNVEKNPLGIDSRIAWIVFVEKLGPSHGFGEGCSEGVFEHAILKLVK